VVRVFDIASNVIRDMIWEFNSPSSVAFWNDNDSEFKILAVGDAMGQITVFVKKNISIDSKPNMIWNSFTKICSIAIGLSSDGPYIITGSINGKISVQYLNEKTSRNVKKLHTDEITSLIALDNIASFISTGRDGFLNLVSRNLDTTYSKFYCNSPITACAMNKKDNILVLGDNEGRIHLMAVEPLAENILRKAFEGVIVTRQIITAIESLEVDYPKETNILKKGFIEMDKNILNPLIKAFLSAKSNIEFINSLRQFLSSI